jgi:anti-anti-sigma factor
MRPGQILVADHDGVHVIKMIGDVRLTLCISFDKFIDSMLSRDDFSAVLFDLSEAAAIDSTTLGLMAKIAIQGQERRGVVPVVFSTNPSINRVLETMGFHDIFTIVSELKAPVAPTQALPSDTSDEKLVQEKVLEAHRILMGMNDQNHETFRNLVKMLERP